jgi:methyl-accepting chemotaxis protein
MLKMLLKSHHAQSNGNGRKESLEAQHDQLLLEGRIKALNRVQAVIHFTPEGIIQDANENFQHVMGYSMEEIRGKHHRIFVDPEYAKSEAYNTFWARLRRGEFIQDEFRRIARGGREVWLQASYNPVFNQNGELLEIIKFATDITEVKLRNAEYRGQIDAINRVQGVIEFNLDGTVITANSLFLDLLGYKLEEIRGQHHRMFVDPAEAGSTAYQQFWENLRSGRPDSRVYKRFGKNGKIAWIQASYNPILNSEGKPFKVIKFANDITNLIQQTESSQLTAQSVATATEELSCSIAEINRNMDDSRKAAGTILATSTESGKEASQLISSMRSMEKIVGLIREIAGRVNLLALNATIEAARAGEAGKGFAVVASEVKSLSDQTAKATNQIDQEITTVQTISKRVADSVQMTVVGVEQVNQSIASVATAMEEQTSVTQEISSHASRLVASVDAILEESRRAK